MHYIFVSVLIIAITDHLLVFDTSYLSQFSEQMDQDSSAHLNRTLKFDSRTENWNGCYTSYRMLTLMNMSLLLLD